MTTSHTHQQPALWWLGSTALRHAATWARNRKAIVKRARLALALKFIPHAAMVSGMLSSARQALCSMQCDVHDRCSQRCSSTGGMLSHYQSLQISAFTPAAADTLRKQKGIDLDLLQRASAAALMGNNWKQSGSWSLILSTTHESVPQCQKFSSLDVDAARHFWTTAHATAVPQQHRQGKVRSTQGRWLLFSVAHCCSGFIQ